MSRPRHVTRRPTYGDAVRWIAENDNPGMDESPAEIAGYISTTLVADLFGVEDIAVAIDVQRTRHGAGPFAPRATVNKGE